MTARINVTLPWPPAECSPNSRKHWARRHELSILVKALARELTIEECAKKKFAWPGGDACVIYEFCPPDKRRRDLDNFQARCKPYLDGICDALGIDDSQIKRSIQEWGGVTDGGQVIITIEAMEEHER